MPKKECIANFNRAYNYFKVLGDDIHIAKTVTNIATTFLDYVFPNVALLKLHYDTVARLSYFEASDLAKYGPGKRPVEKPPESTKSTPAQPQSGHKRSDSLTGHKRSDSQDSASHKRNDSTEEHKTPADPTEYYISYEKIENPAVCGLDIYAETYDMIPLTQAHLNMAEIRYLKGDEEIAIAFWKEARDQ